MRPLTPADVPLVDDFATDSPPGRVIGTLTRSGHRRDGVDVEQVMSIDHGALRIKPLERPGWGRAALAYGPLELCHGLAASVTLVNGRNGSENVEPWPSPTDWAKQWIRGTQSDGPPVRMLRALRFPRRDSLVRRWRAARADARCPPTERDDVNLIVAWSRSAATPDVERDPALIVRATGPYNAELCLGDAEARRPVATLFELPMRLVLLCTDGQLAVLASFDDGTGTWPSPTYLGTIPAPVGDHGWLSLQQRTLGQVGWGMDTRVREVRIDRLAEVPTVAELAGGATVALPCEVPERGRRLDGVVELDERFRADAADLAGRSVGTDAWRHVVGERPIRLTGDCAEVGEASPAPAGRVARLFHPSGQRTAYVVGWGGGAGSVAALITPPGARRGDGQAGRAGLILYQDPANFLIVNDWLDDEYGGASVSAFRRIAGFEEVFDAVWVNVGDRITWGRRHELGLAFDVDGFTAYLDGVAVLDRDYRDVYPTAAPLQVRAVGICANWEFGDDTGSRFHSFTVRRRSAE